jgi:hypothetical protein
MAGEAAAGQGTAARRQVTFTKDVAPILQRSCENCHRKGGVAPMSLTTYEETRPWARAIKAKTATREMPPWFIEKNVGIQRFKDDPSLSDEEIARVGTWVDSGAPRGNPADMPPARQYADGSGWSIGTPDLVVSSPVSVVKAMAPDWHGEVGPVPLGLTEDRYVMAAEVREVRTGQDALERTSGKSGDLNYFALHHAGVREQYSDEVVAKLAERGEADDSRPGEGFYLVYELGQNATVYPANTGVILRAGSSLSFTLHLHSIGKDVPVRVDVAFKFHPKDFKPKYVQQGFISMGGNTSELDLPAGRRNLRYDGFYTMPKSGILTTFEPHLHMSGKRMCVEAIYPTGSREMLNCAGYNHNWVKTYVYEDDAAPLLPKGTILRIMGWYDTSESNPRNIEPRNWKGWGNRSIDDMFIFLPKVTFVTEDQFKELLAERQAKERVTSTASN